MKTGDYVRTKWGIARLTDITTYPCNPFKDEIEEGEPTFTVYYIDTCFIPIDETRIWKEDIIKSSPNIIDLIEVGDYVNAFKITYIDEPDKYNSKRMLYFEEPTDYVIKTFIDEDIKSIVTKEQFKSIEYKVGDKENE